MLMGWRRDIMLPDDEPACDVNITKLCEDNLKYTRTCFLHVVNMNRVEIMSIW